MMVMFVVTLVVMSLGCSRNRHEHGDRENRRAERKQHLLHWYLLNASGSRRTVASIYRPWL
jgi:hypothetical protein